MILTQTESKTEEFAFSFLSCYQAKMISRSFSTIHSKLICGIIENILKFMIIHYWVYSYFRVKHSVFVDKNMKTCEIWNWINTKLQSIDWNTFTKKLYKNYRIFLRCIPILFVIQKIKHSVVFDLWLKIKIKTFRMYPNSYSLSQTIDSYQLREYFDFNLNLDLQVKWLKWNVHRHLLYLFQIERLSIWI